MIDPFAEILLNIKTIERRADGATDNVRRLIDLVSEIGDRTRLVPEVESACRRVAIELGALRLLLTKLSPEELHT